MAEDIVRFKDFSFSAEPVTFRISPDTFECAPEIPLDSIVELSMLSVSDGDRKAQFERMKDFLDGILVYESAALFRQRCKPGTQEEPNPYPIGMRHVQALLPWFMEVYGLRPTQPSSESEDGSADVDTSLTDGVSVEELTS
jgi:hypothetical protein